jgi:hypothetical protein
MSAPRLVLAAAVIGGATLFWWLVAGARLVALADRFTTLPQGPPESPTPFTFNEPNEATYEEPTLAFGDRQRTAPRSWRIVDRRGDHFTIETPQGTITLGVVMRRQSRGGDLLTYEFEPEPGDVVTFTRRQSRVPWPRPFAINWLGGSSARWGRWVYHRLVWRKPSGTVLEVVWRDEQRLQPGSGWMDQYLPWPPVMTMLRVGGSTR